MPIIPASNLNNDRITFQTMLTADTLRATSFIFFSCSISYFLPNKKYHDRLSLPTCLLHSPPTQIKRHLKGNDFYCPTDVMISSVVIFYDPALALACSVFILFLKLEFLLFYAKLFYLSIIFTLALHASIFPSNTVSQNILLGITSQWS